MANEYIAKDYKGSSQPTTLSNAYTTANASIVVADGSTFPPGGPGAYFVIVVSKGLADEEKMLISTRTGNTLTIVEKGYDGTTQLAHPAGSSVNHCLDAYTLLQANRYANLQTAKGDLVVRTASTTVRLPIGTDDYPLVADSAATNGLAWKQITTNSISNNAVTNAKIGLLAVDTAQLAAGAVTNSKIVDDAVQTSKILNGAITTAKLDTGAVTSAKIASGAVTPSELATDSVITTKILNLNVTTGKIALLAVDTAQLAAGAVTADKIATNTITASKIANNAITASELSTASVTGIKIDKNIRNFSADYTVVDSDYILNHTATSNTVLTLPLAASYPGRSLQIRNCVSFYITSALNNIVSLTSSSTPRQVFSLNLILSSTDGSWCELVSNGTNWLIVNASELT